MMIIRTGATETEKEFFSITWDKILCFSLAFENRVDTSQEKGMESIGKD